MEKGLCHPLECAFIIRLDLCFGALRCKFFAVLGLHRLRHQLMKQQRMVVGHWRQAACDARLGHNPASVPSHHCVLIPLCLRSHTTILDEALGGHPELLPLLADWIWEFITVNIMFCYIKNMESNLYWDALHCGVSIVDYVRLRVKCMVTLRTWRSLLPSLVASACFDGLARPRAASSAG